MVRVVTRQEWLALYERGLLEDIITVRDFVIARKVGHDGPNDQNPIEVIVYELP